MSLDEIGKLDKFLGSIDYDKVDSNNDYYKFSYITYSLYESMLYFIDYADDNRDRILIGRNRWMNLITDYYNNLNILKNILVGRIEINDTVKQDIKSSYNLVYELSRSVFRGEGRRPYVMDAIISGKFYVSFYYYLTKIELSVLKIEDNEVLNKKNKLIELFENEFKVIKKAEKVVLENEDNIGNIDNDTQYQLTGMWERTKDFINNNLKDMRGDINN